MLFSKQSFKRPVILSFSGALFAGPTISHAAERYWVGPANGLWSNPANWSTTPGGPGGAGVPQIGDAALSSNGINAVFDYSYEQPGVGVSVFAPVRIQQDSPLSKLVVFSSLTLPRLQFSGDAVGRYIQNAGTVIVNRDLQLGHSPLTSQNIQGFYTLSGDSHLTVTMFMYIANGTFTQTGGSATIGNNIELGGFGKPGGVAMSGGTLSIGGGVSQLVGASTFSGGHTTIGGLLATGLGSVTLSAGVLSVGSVEVYGGGIGSQFVQNGGSLLVQDRLSVGSASFYRFNGGSLACGTLNVNGTVNIAGGQFLMSPGGDKVARTRGITTTGTGKMDITDNAATVDYEAGNSPIDSIRSQIVSGFNNGSWNGNGINSSSAAANPGHGIGYAEASELFTSFPAGFRGVEVDETTLLIAYARYGDANLDGVVNLSDFNRLAANFGGTNVTWSQGDFNYDGMSNLSDFNLLAANFGLSASPDGPTPEDWATLAAVVPEPSAVLLSGVAASAVMLFRRKRLNHS